MGQLLLRRQKATRVSLYCLQCRRKRLGKEKGKNLSLTSLSLSIHHFGAEWGCGCGRSKCTRNMPCGDVVCKFEIYLYVYDCSKYYVVVGQAKVNMLELQEEGY